MRRLPGSATPESIRATVEVVSLDFSAAISMLPPTERAELICSIIGKLPLEAQVVIPELLLDQAKKELKIDEMKGLAFIATLSSSGDRADKALGIAAFGFSTRVTGPIS